MLFWSSEKMSFDLWFEHGERNCPKTPCCITVSDWELCVPEVFPRDGVQLVGDGTVDARLRSFPRRLEERGEDGEEYRHEGRVPGQVRVHRARVHWVHRHIGIWEEEKHKQQVVGLSLNNSHHCYDLVCRSRFASLSMCCVFVKGLLLYCFSSICYRSQIYTKHVSDWLKHQTDHSSIP